MKCFFRNITPVFVVALLGILFLMVQFFISGKDYNIFAYLFVYIVLLCLLLSIDRYLVSKIAYKKLFIAEIALIVCATFWYIFSAGYAEVKIDTTKPYFFIVYDDGGLKKSEMPSAGLFKTSIRLNAESAVRLNYSLKNETLIDPPPSWNYDYLTNVWDTVVGSNKIELQLFALKLSQEKMDSLLRAEIPKILIQSPQK